MLYYLVRLDGKDEDVIVELSNRRVFIAGLGIQFPCEDQSTKDYEIRDTDVELELRPCTIALLAN